MKFTDDELPALQQPGMRLEENRASGRGGNRGGGRPAEPERIRRELQKAARYFDRQDKPDEAAQARELAEQVL